MGWSKYPLYTSDASHEHEIRLSSINLQHFTRTKYSRLSSSNTKTPNFVLAKHLARSGAFHFPSTITQFGCDGVIVGCDSLTLTSSVFCMVK